MTKAAHALNGFGSAIDRIAGVRGRGDVPRVAAVTSFHEEGYRTHGQQMVESFDRHWPQDVPLLVYAEEFAPPAPSARVVVRDLLQASADLVAFRNRHKDNPRAHGWSGRRYRIVCQWHKLRIKLRRVGPEDAYRWQAVRFAHKPFAIFHAAAHCDADVLFWLDSDLVMLADLPRPFLAGMMPRGAMLSCIRRPKFTDCSIVGFNLREPATARFLAQFRELYTTDKLFALREYHDSFLFDVVRRRFERAGAEIDDLAKGAGAISGHVFNHCPLGRYMDHLKGERKYQAAILRPPLAIGQGERAPTGGRPAERQMSAVP